MQLDRAEAAPLVAALNASSGETRDAIEEALARLEVVEAPGPARGFAAAPAGGVDPALVGARPGSSWFGEPMPWLEEDVAPIAVTHWFEHAVTDGDVNAGADIVAWVYAYGERFRPELDGLFAQYRRVAGDETLARQIAWTVARGGLRGLVPGLARALASADETERTAAARLIADVTDTVLEAEPPTFGFGYQAAPRADHVQLAELLVDAARAGVVPHFSEPPTELLPQQPPAPEPVVPVAPAELPDEAAPPRRPRRRRPRLPWSRTHYALDKDGPSEAPSSSAYWLSRLSPRAGWIVGVAVLAGSSLAVAKWVFGWLTVSGEGALRADEVQCTVFAPPAAAPRDATLVQVFAHLAADAADARAIATELDVAAQRRAYRSLAERVRIGSRLEFELRLPGLQIDDPVASLVWQGRTEAVQFGVTVPESTRPGTVIGTVSISRGGAPLGHVKFALAIASAATKAEPEPQGVEAKRYRVAFVSYASRDRDEVLRRVQVLQVAGLSYFQDVLSLEAGEHWSERIEKAIREADVFLLFWSSRAKESEWVRKEVDFALALKAGDELAAPEIRPVIIEGPPVIAPWDDLAHLHFNDRVLYFMGRPTT
jgi:TIR domain-containing protein